MLAPVSPLALNGVGRHGPGYRVVMLSVYSGKTAQAFNLIEAEHPAIMAAVRDGEAHLEVKEDVKLVA